MRLYYAGGGGGGGGRWGGRCMRELELARFVKIARAFYIKIHHVRYVRTHTMVPHNTLLLVYDR